MIEGFTVFIVGFESFARDSGLSLGRAFALVVELVGYAPRFDGGSLTLTGSNEELVLTSSAGVATDARRELMMQAVDGRLRGFKALPDAVFLGVAHGSRTS